jgi:hypothetical protein
LAGFIKELENGTVNGINIFNNMIANIGKAASIDYSKSVTTSQEQIKN